MPVKIENRLDDFVLFFNIEKKIMNLVKAVPQSHLIGLEKIIIVKSFHVKKLKDVAAIYNRRSDYIPANIEISFESVFLGMHRIFLLFPFVVKFTLASVLYHKIGHHYHHSFQHGVKKKKSEVFADNYKKEMLKKVFWWWAIILRPVAPIIKYIVKRSSNPSS